jgi:hypothetical protein
MQKVRECNETSMWMSRKAFGKECRLDPSQRIQREKAVTVMHQHDERIGFFVLEKVGTDATSHGILQTSSQGWTQETTTDPNQNAVPCRPDRKSSITFDATNMAEF